MNILGLTAFSHESAACLIQDGQITAFIEEERFNREKHASVFPLQAIKAVLKQAKIRPNDIDQITFFWQPWLEMTQNLVHLFRYFPASLNLFTGPSGSDRYTFSQRVLAVLSLKKYLASVSPDLAQKPIFYCPHHLAHSASAFFVSPFDQAAILTLDGRGEAATSMMAIGEDNIIKVLQTEKIPHSLGLLYSAVTDYLGFTAFSDEGKVMGLSAYGNQSLVKLMRPLIKLKAHGRVELNLKYFSFHTHGRQQWLSPLFIKRFGSKQKQNIARALQVVLEIGAIHMVKHLYRLTHSPNLCLAGGVALNCLMTREIIRQTGFKNIFVQPVPNDAGAALGSALYFYHQCLKQPCTTTLKHVYFGPEYSDTEILTQLKKTRLNYVKLKSITAVVAKMISQGKIIAWFQGRMEVGPRALGNRSLLADPRRQDMKAILNQRVKHREWFRPFAPSVLVEHALEFFDVADSPYMILLAKVNSGKQKLIPAVTHVDKTARLQTVSLETNPRYWQLIHDFYQLTKIPLVLNTSFNDIEPIVCTPAQAITTFTRTDIDALAIGNFLVTKKS